MEMHSTIWKVHFHFAINHSITVYNPPNFQDNREVYHGIYERRQSVYSC